MKQGDKHFQDHLEWEILEPEQVITHIVVENGLYNLRPDCIISFSRDSQYNIVATIAGIVTSHKELEPNIDKLKGTFMPEEKIIGYSPGKEFKYTLHGIAIDVPSFMPVSIDGVIASRFTAELIVHKVDKEPNYEVNETQSMQEWYLLGNVSVSYSRSTERSVHEHLKKIRRGTDPENAERIIQGSGSSWDHLLIKYADTSFIVSEVPKQYRPEWGYKLAIEYRKSFGRIPDDKERKLVAELVGFVLGNQLLKIGETFYDRDLSTNAQSYRSPSGDNVLGICDTSGTPPVEIGYSIHQRGNAEVLINTFLPKYMELCDNLQLSGVLSKYWLSKYAIVGINLPILSSALESLAENMLNRHPEVKEYYMEFNAYNELIKDEVTIIDNKLGSIPNKEKIINKIKGAAQRGPNEKLNMMFEIIGLELGKVEKNAVKARNKMAHTSFGEIPVEEAQKIIRITRAYETLFNRVILKILSHNGEYIDYYTFNRPNRKIEEPIPDDTLPS